MTPHTKESLSVLSIAELTVIFNQVSGKNIKKAKGSKEAIAERILSLVVESVAEGAPDEDARAEQPRRMTMKDRLRGMFRVRSAWNADEFWDEFTDKAESSVRATLSDLKNPRYAGGPLLIINFDRKTKQFYEVNSDA